VSSTGTPALRPVNSYRGRKAGRLDTACASFFELVLNEGGFPFRELVLPSRSSQRACGAGRWAAADQGVI
jgi:hypothetical protein